MSGRRPGSNPNTPRPNIPRNKRVNKNNAAPNLNNRGAIVADTTGDSEATSAAVMEEIALDQETIDAKAWITERVDAELARIRSTGTAIDLAKAKNFGVVIDISRKKPSAINRIEIDTMEIDFKLVQQIMVSPKETYPHKENYEYVHVLLFFGPGSDPSKTTTKKTPTGKTITTVTGTRNPMLVPYLYDTKLKIQEPKEGQDLVTTSSLQDQQQSNGGGVVTTVVDEKDWIPVKNALTEWLLVNGKHQRARHHIDEFHDI